MIEFIMNNENLIFLQDENAIMVSPYEDGNTLFHSDRSDAFIIFDGQSDNLLERRIYDVFFKTLESMIGRFLLIGHNNKRLSNDFVDLNEKSVKLTSLYKNSTIELLYGDNCIALSIHKEILDDRESVTLVTDGIKYFQYNDILLEMQEKLLNTVYSYNIGTSVPVLQKEYLS